MSDWEVVAKRAPVLVGSALERGVGKQDLQITVEPPMARFVVRVLERDAGLVKLAAGVSLTIPVNTSATEGPRRVARLGPDFWTVLAPMSERAALAADLTRDLEPVDHAVVEYSDAEVTFVIAGDAARNVVNAGCPLDLDDRAFAPGTATRTVFGKAAVTLWRPGAAAVFEMHCGRSFGPYVRAMLAEAARDA